MKTASQLWSRWFFLLGLVGILLPSAMGGARALDVLHFTASNGTDCEIAADDAEGAQRFHLLLAELAEVQEEAEGIEGSSLTACRSAHALNAGEPAQQYRTAQAVAWLQHLVRLALKPRAYLLHQSWKIHPLAEAAGK